MALLNKGIFYILIFWINDIYMYYILIYFYVLYIFNLSQNVPLRHSN